MYKRLVPKWIYLLISFTSWLCELNLRIFCCCYTSLQCTVLVGINHTERWILFTVSQAGAGVVSSNVVGGDTVLRFRLHPLQFAAAVLVLVSDSYCSRLRNRRTTFCQLSRVCYNSSLLQRNVGIALPTCNSWGPQTCTHINKVPCATTWDFINVRTPKAWEQLRRSDFNC